MQNKKESELRIVVQSKIRTVNTEELIRMKVGDLFIQ